MLRQWEELPEYMRLLEVKPYYNSLKKKQFSLYVKRLFDFITAVFLLTILAFPMMIIALWIKTDSKGPVFFRQERVTTCGKIFRIHKFRTMVSNADRLGTAVTVDNDQRITKVGKVLRDLRLDELPQLIDILEGNMSFVGTRPEVIKYVRAYTPEMRATLLLPAGITSEASIRYKDESSLLNSVEDVDQVYISQVLPKKMRYNLYYLDHFSWMTDLLIMLRTVLAVIK